MCIYILPNTESEEIQHVCWFALWISILCFLNLIMIMNWCKTKNIFQSQIPTLYRTRDLPRNRTLSTCSMHKLSQKWIITAAFIFRGALHIYFNWGVVQGNTDTSVAFLFCLYMTVFSTWGGSGYVCFKGVVVTDVQVTSCHLCKPWDGVREGWKGGSFIWVTVPAFEHNGIPVVSRWWRL